MVKGADDLLVHLADVSAYCTVLSAARRPAGPEELLNWIGTSNKTWTDHDRALEVRRAIYYSHSLLPRESFLQWRERLTSVLGRHAKKVIKASLRDLRGTERTKEKRPTIFISTKEGHVVQQAMSALVGHQEKAGLYQRCGQLVRVLCGAMDETSSQLLIRREAEAPRIVPLPAPWTEVLLADAALWLTATDDGDKPSCPPAFASKAVATAGEWPGLRTLVGLTETPVLRADGTILDAPGYDDLTGIFYAPLQKIPTIKGNPSRADALRALAILLEPVVDFPFEAEVHQAVWIAALLTGLSRWAFDGPSPLFLIEASTRGTGKTLLAQVFGLIVSGRILGCTTLPDDEDERRKWITALALEGANLVLVDNVDGVLGGAALNAALTSTVWKGRILGASKTTGDLPFYATWVVTANNAQIGADTMRRTIPLRLVTELERPESRTGFVHDDLLQWVREQRGTLVAAALTILSAFWSAGKPRQGLPASGSFEQWTIIRDACVWLGLPDPLEAQRIATENSDSDASELRGLLAGLEDLCGSEWISASDVVERLNRTPRFGGAREGAILRNTLAEYVSGPAGAPITPKKLAGRLRRYRGRVSGGKSLVSRDGRSGIQEWRVESSKGPIPGGSGGSGESSSAPPKVERCNLDQDSDPKPGNPRDGEDHSHPPNLPPTSEDPSTKCIIVTTPDEAVAACGVLAEQSRVGFNILATSGTRDTTESVQGTRGRERGWEHTRLLLLSTSNVVFAFDLTLLGGISPAFRAIIEGPAIKVVHGAPVIARLMLRDFGIEVANMVDIYVGAVLADGYVDHRKLDKRSLDQMAEHFLGVVPPEVAESHTGTHAGLAIVAWRTSLLLSLLDNVLVTVDAAGVDRAWEIESDLAVPLAAIEVAGLGFDSVAASRHIAAWRTDESASRAGVLSTLGPINLDAPAQLVKAVSDRLGLVLPGSKDEDIEQALGRLPVGQDLLRIRRLARYATQMESLCEAAKADGRIHSTFDALGAPTGRMSCSAPNLQGIPRDARFRSLFVPVAGSVFVKADYKAIELRVIADYVEEAELIRCFHEGIDPHTRTAAVISKKLMHDVTAEERRRAKPINFGFAFGMGAATFVKYAKNAGIAFELSEARIARCEFFSFYSKINDWHQAVSKSGPLSTEVRTASGRRRVLPFGCFTEHLNTPIQGTAADGMKRALTLLHPALRSIGARIVNVIHDEVLVEVPAEHADEAKHIVETLMVAGMSEFVTSVPIEVEISLCSTWAGS